MALKLRIQKIDLTDGTSGHWFARAHICVSGASTDPYDDGRILLSPDCRTATEVEAYADDLIRDLEKIKREAKAADWSG